MTRRMPLFVVLVAAVCVFQGLFPQPHAQPASVAAFGRLPVLSEGRIKPLDSVARSTLLVIQGRQRVELPDGAELTPDEWLLDVMFFPEKADDYRVFVVDNTDLLSLIGKSEDSLKIHYESTAKQVGALIGIVPSSRRRMSFNEIAPYLAQIEAQEKLAEPVQAQARTRFQSAVIQLYANLSHYLRLRRSVLPEGGADFLGELLSLQGNLVEGIEAVRAKEAGKPHDEAKAAAIIDEGQKFVSMAESTDLLVVPPDGDNPDPNGWHNAGRALLETFGKGEVDPAIRN